MNPDKAISNDIVLRRFKFPQSIIARFVTRRSLRSAILWAIIFGIYVASKIIGFVDIYPTAAAREKVTQTFSGNVGIQFLVGKAPHTSSTGAYGSWSTLVLMVVIGSIWGMLLATKYLRGEEDNGRFEVMLAGQTTQRKSVLNVIAALSVIFAVFYIIIVLLFSIIGKYKGVDFGLGASALFGLAVVSCMAIFTMIGALASQLMPTRSKAATITGIIIGLAYLLRGVADITSASWLLNFTPIGWAEKLQPLSSPQPLWFIPILITILIFGGLTIYFAGKRDFGESILADKVNSKPKYRNLNSPLGLAYRMSKVGNSMWLMASLLMAILYGFITKISAPVFSQSKSASHFLATLYAQQQTASIEAFLGIVFLMQMVLLIAYTVTATVSIRKEEAEGYLDNFIVRRITRNRWFFGRIFIILSVLIFAAILTSIGVYIGIKSQGINLTFGTLLSASVNELIPALFVLAIGVFIFGIKPRLTNIVVYGVFAWSFLIEMVSSGLNINHWIVDTSIFHQISLAPAANVNWKIDIYIVIIVIIMICLGAFLFNHRDIETE